MFFVAVSRNLNRITDNMGLLARARAGVQNDPGDDTERQEPALGDHVQPVQRAGQRERGIQEHLDGGEGGGEEGGPHEAGHFRLMQAPG